MSDTDIWFSALSFRQKLSVLGYFKNWDYEACSEMTSLELIVAIGFPPRQFPTYFLMFVTWAVI